MKSTDQERIQAHKQAVPQQALQLERNKKNGVVPATINFLHSDSSAFSALATALQASAVCRNDVSLRRCSGNAPTVSRCRPPREKQTPWHDVIGKGTCKAWCVW